MSSVTLIGGMTRLKRDYINAAKQMGIKLKVFHGTERNIVDKLGEPDMMIIFTGHVSHKARKQAAEHGRANNIPTQMVHSCGISSLRKCLQQ